MVQASVSEAVEWLFPRPRACRVLGTGWVLPAQLGWSGPEAVPRAALEWVEQELRARGHGFERTGGGPGGLELRMDPSHSSAPGGEQGYELRLGAGRISLAAGCAAGLQYGLATLAQLIALAPGAPGQLQLPELELSDAPDFRERGVMLDVSRDKVPALRTLRMLIDRLARWKVNQLQLYMEHTFAYVGHQRVWQHASPLTAEDIEELAAYCAERHIQLVPNQNSFGHMHRWLVHEPYRQLAECPDGFDHPWNWSKEPYGLCATDPGSLALLEELYDQLLPHFPGRLFNVGLDETIDLGAGRSRAACEARGTERVYLEFLREVHTRVQARGRRMMFWGDIIVKRPELIAELPRDAIALEWGYEADHPFAEHLELFQRAGLEFYVCPGTSSWNSIAGRTDNALGNLARAALAGKAAGATGLLTTDWGDHGHLQPLPVSYLGLLLGSGFSWNVASAERATELDLAGLLDRHAFSDPTGSLGAVARDLGNAYREAGSLRPNSSVLFWALIKPERLFEPPGVTRETLEHTLAFVERASEPLAAARPALSDGPLLCDELGWARDALRFACRLGIERAGLGDRDAVSSIRNSTRAALARQLHELIERHRALWHARNRPGGLADSAGRLEQLLAPLL